MSQGEFQGEPLYSLGWGTPEEYKIAQPLEQANDSLVAIERRIANQIANGLRVAGDQLKQLQSSVAGNIAAWCEECRITLDSCNQMVGARIEDKLACIRYALDNVCDKCPDAERIVWGAIGDIPQQPTPAPLPNYPSPGYAGVGGPVETMPMQVGNVSGSTAPAIIQPYPPVAQRIETYPQQPSIPQPTQPLPFNPVVIPGIQPQILPQQPSSKYGCQPGELRRPGGCVVKNYATNQCEKKHWCDVLGSFGGGGVAVFCSEDQAELDQAFNDICKGVQPIPSLPSPTPAPQPVPQYPGQPICVVCGQCHEPKQECPKCEEQTSEYCAWRKKSGACYVLDQKDKPLDSDDIRIDCAKDLKRLAKAMESECGICKEEEPSGGKIISNPIAVGVGSILCQLLAYTEDGSATNWISDATSNPLTRLLLGDATNLADALKNAEKECNSINPITKLWGCVKYAYFSFLDTIDSTLFGSLQRTGCADTRFLQPAVGYIIVGFLEKWISSDLNWLSQPLKYAANSACPVAFPSVDAATQAFLHGEIDYQTLSVWIRQNGYCVEPWNTVVRARQSRLTPIEAVSALRRNIITEDEYREIIRGNGFIGPNAGDEFLGILRPIPPITDLIRMMVRDVEDPAIYRKFKLDEGFTDKWTGKLKVWGEQQGIDDEIALRYWRAHWSIPSPSQLYQMYHRSRGMKPTDKGYVSLETVREALIYQDIAPYWVDPLLNTTYSLLRLVDIRRAYEINAIDRDQVNSQLVKRGYSEDDAKIITEFYVRAKQEKLLRDLAVRLFERGEIDLVEMTRRLTAKGATAETIERAVNDAQPKLLRCRQVQLYERWQLNESEVRRSLQDLGARTDTIERAVEMGRRVRLKPHRQRCLNAIRKRFITGEFSDDKLRGILVDSGFGTAETDELVALWNCEKAAKGKEFTAAAMCGYVESGLITPLNMWERLQRLGYKPDDAATIVAQCGLKLGTKAQKELDRIERERIRLQDRAKKELERQQAAVAKAISKDAARIERLNKAREAREQRLETATQFLVSTTGATYDDAGMLIRQLWDTLTKQYSLTPNERVHVIVTAIQRGQPKTLSDAEATVYELADEAEQLSSVAE